MNIGGDRPRSPVLPLDSRPHQPDGAQYSLEGMYYKIRRLAGKERVFRWSEASQQWVVSNRPLSQFKTATAQKKFKVAPRNKARTSKARRRYFDTRQLRFKEVDGLTEAVKQDLLDAMVRTRQRLTKRNQLKKRPSLKTNSPFKHVSDQTMQREQVFNSNQDKLKTPEDQAAYQRALDQSPLKACYPVLTPHGLGIIDSDDGSPELRQWWVCLLNRLCYWVPADQITCLLKEDE